MGLTNRHGPHHGAQRSTSTGGAAFASTSNVASVAFTTHGNGLPHLPQCGAPRGAGRIVFFVPQFAHTSVEIGPLWAKAFISRSEIPTRGQPTLVDVITCVESHVVYENPQPQLRSRPGYFPGIVELPGGELVALLVIGEAFEAVDLTTYVSRSADAGRTWQLQGPVIDKAAEHPPTSDFLKPVLRRDGSLLALGYRFLREDPDPPTPSA